MSLLPTDWTGSNYPAWCVVHGKGASERMWAGGCPTNPNMLYVSSNSTDDFSDANVLVFYIETGDGLGIVGASEFGDRLLLFGKTRSFVMEDSDTNTDNWGYVSSQWEGGAAHHGLIVRVPNDLVVMTDTGDIYSVTAVQDYGDYKMASIARPANINRWIEDNASLSNIADCHAVYDPTLRAIKFFIVRIGKTSPDMALVYFIDRGTGEGWVKHQNYVYQSGYSAVCSTVVKASDGIIRYTLETMQVLSGNWKTEHIPMLGISIILVSQLLTYRLIMYALQRDTIRAGLL
jgi:hypothetical protein